MKVTITRQSSIASTQLFSETESTALALLRNHVRAIDDSEDDLLKIYLDAALDYMQTLTDRLLGVHDVTVYINKEESKRPVSVPGIQDVTSVGNLHYFSKDSDEEVPWQTIYKVIGEAEDAEGEAPFGITYLTSQVYEAGDDGTFEVTFSNSVTLPEGALAVTFGTEKLSTTGAYVYSDPAGTTVTQNGTAAYPNGYDFGVGYYRIKATTVYTNGDTKVAYKYFTVSNGKDFDNRIITDRYPIYIDVSNGLALIEDPSDYDEDFWMLELTAGTALGSLPKQYKQAALLLVGHYYNMREAENVGGISSELKEGVQRLMASARQY